MITNLNNSAVLRLSTLKEIITYFHETLNAFISLCDTRVMHRAKDLHTSLNNNRQSRSSVWTACTVLYHIRALEFSRALSTNNDSAFFVIGYPFFQSKCGECMSLWVPWRIGYSSPWTFCNCFYLKFLIDIRNIFLLCDLTAQVILQHWHTRLQQSLESICNVPRVTSNSDHVIKHAPQNALYCSNDSFVTLAPPKRAHHQTWTSTVRYKKQNLSPPSHTDCCSVVPQGNCYFVYHKFWLSSLELRHSCFIPPRQWSNS